MKVVFYIIWILIGLFFHFGIYAGIDVIVRTEDIGTLIFSIIMCAIWWIITIGIIFIHKKKSIITIKLIDANDEKIKELENGSAFTWEGMNLDPKNLDIIAKEFVKIN